MALTRGVNGNYPCPVCLVPQSEQSHTWQTYQLRTAEQSKMLVMKALKEPNATRRNEIVKVESLCPVMVWFFTASSWDIYHSCPFFDTECLLGCPVLWFSQSNLIWWNACQRSWSWWKAFFSTAERICIRFGFSCTPTDWWPVRNTMAIDWSIQDLYIYRMRVLPPWSGLKIQDKIMSVNFSDANKFRDILKVCGLSCWYFSSAWAFGRCSYL